MKRSLGLTVAAELVFVAAAPAAHQKSTLYADGQQRARPPRSFRLPRIRPE